MRVEQLSAYGADQLVASQRETQHVSSKGDLTEIDRMEAEARLDALDRSARPSTKGTQAIRAAEPHTAL